jgi:hypothetical protein
MSSGGSIVRAVAAPVLAPIEAAKGQAKRKERKASERARAAQASQARIQQETERRQVAERAQQELKTRVRRRRIFAGDERGQQLFRASLLGEAQPSPTETQRRSILGG